MINQSKYVHKRVSFVLGFFTKKKFTGTIVFAEIGQGSKKLLFTIKVDNTEKLEHLFEDEVTFL